MVNVRVLIRIARLTMIKNLSCCFLLVLALTGSMLGQSWSEWGSTKNVPEIKYRVQVLENAQACYLEFRDDQQGKGSTTFDVNVDYRPVDVDSNKTPPPPKTETEHLVTTPGRAATARISDCSAVTEARASYIQRH